MRPTGEALIASATDLSNSLRCRHLTALEMAVERGKLPRPYWHRTRFLTLFFQRGLSYEKAYVDSLMAEGLRILALAACRTFGVSPLFSTTALFSPKL